MYISDKNRKEAVETAVNYLLISLICALFGAIYEFFSHGVYSYHMIYAFAFPLAGGVLPFLLIAAGDIRIFPGWPARCLHHAGIATLTVGSLLRGALEIYGTTNALLKIYPLAGAVLIAAGIAVTLAGQVLTDPRNEVEY